MKTDKCHRSTRTAKKAPPKKKSGPKKSVSCRVSKHKKPSSTKPSESSSLPTDDYRHLSDEELTKADENRIAERRKVLQDSLAGIALVFRFGNPSELPTTRHERKTYDKAARQDRKKRCYNDENKTKEFFHKCGVSLVENVCSADLEDRLINRTVDIVIEKRDIKISRRSGEQPFHFPHCVDNRELYLVSTSSCKRMIRQKGRPFADDDDGARFAWAVDGEDIYKEGTDAKIEKESIAQMAGGTLMPNVKGNTNHSQNLDNPDNQPFLELLEILKCRFARILNKDNHRMMCLQLILAEDGRQMGERGFHQDMWATTGACIIGATILNDRKLEMCHNGRPRVSVLYHLPRRSAYSLSGAARYGTLWKGLNSEFFHCLHAFRGKAEGKAEGKTVGEEETVSVSTWETAADALETSQVSCSDTDTFDGIHTASVPHQSKNEKLEQLRGERDAALAEVARLKRVIEDMSPAPSVQNGFAIFRQLLGHTATKLTLGYFSELIEKTGRLPLPKEGKQGLASTALTKSSHQGKSIASLLMSKLKRNGHVQASTQAVKVCVETTSNQPASRVQPNSFQVISKGVVKDNVMSESPGTKAYTQSLPRARSFDFTHCGMADSDGPGQPRTIGRSGEVRKSTREPQPKKHFGIEKYDYA